MPTNRGTSYAETPREQEHDMTNPHRIEVTDGEAWTGTMVCDAPAGAACRMHCDVCEEYLEDDHDTHELRDQGYCLKVEGWFDDSIEGCYDGPDRGHRESIESGPVLISWNGDWMVWEYDNAATPAHVDG